MNKIKIYSTPWCVYCQMAKEYFKSINIEFEEYDVSTNEEKKQEMINKTKQFGVPVIDIDGQIIIGFDKNAIDQIIKK